MRIPKKDVELAVCAAVEKIGFRKRGRLGLYLYDFGDKVMGWLGVTVQIYRAEQLYMTYATVGVHYPELERLFYELTGPSYRSRGPTATVANNLGNLTDEARFYGYPVAFDAKPNKAVKCMVKDLKKYGLPWSRSLIDREVLATTMARLNPPDYAAIRLPILYWLEGRHELIDATIAEYYAKRGYGEWFPEYYGAFEKRLRKLIEESTSSDL